MNTLGFILGREQEISLAEINAVFERENIEFFVDYLSQNVLIISSKKDLSQITIKLFGGVIKIFNVVAFGPHQNELETILANIKPEQTEKRVNFGISGYGNISQKTIFNLGKKVKEQFSEQKISSRFVTGKYKDLTSVIVHENKLIERGFEAILVENNGRYIVGSTREVQDYKSYSKFDYGRPFRDDRAGMIPPKLAQIMINLSKAGRDNVIYDPFCGSGTIIGEAILMDYRNVFGSDISEKAVTDSKANLRWIEQNFNTIIPHSTCHPERFDEKVKRSDDQDCDAADAPRNNKVEIFVSDILNPARKINTDAVVGEGFLGEPIRRNKDQAIKDAEVLAKFYEDAIKNMTEMLNENGRIVIAIPFFIVNNEQIFLPLQTNLKKVNPLAKFNIKYSERNTLSYFRKDQFVGREILILEK